MKRSFAIITFLLIFLVALSGCSPAEELPEPTDGVSAATEARYQETEVREYEGVQLDPAIGPRDNSITGVQEVDMDTYEMKITGLVNEPMTYLYDQVLEKEAHRRLITLYCVEGWNATVLWEGVRIMDLLTDAGVQKEGTIAIFHCVDGYTTSMPLEIIEDRDMLLAYSSNGVTLPASMGYPFIVVAEDKLGYKWARWVNEIEISSNTEYRGFWETRGYGNEAEVKK
jgi:DMSO/TMAO reductase YedYZ molybdopterin-dependent catalytic subunit